MKKLLFVTLLITACGPDREVVQIYQGTPGKDGLTTYITTQTVLPGGSCGVAGGLRIVPYTDANRNGSLDLGEETLLASNTVCNGSQGAPGLVGAQGPQGLIGPQGAQGIQGIQGIAGVAGPKGDQGLQGVQGIQGLVGAQGPKGEPGIQGIPGASGQSGITPVKLCPSDTSAFPEYGFVIGSNLYAVYYGVIGGGLNSFMALLTPGSYVTTNGSGCSFTYTTPSGIPTINGVPVGGNSNGLSVAVHNLPSWSGVSLPSLYVGNPVVGTFTLPNLNIPNNPSSAGFPGMPSSLRSLVGDDGYALDISGYLNVPTTGNYVFKLTSDDGAIFLINDQVVIADDSLHAPRTVTSIPVRLNRGLNRINVIYYQGPHTQIALQLKWSGPNLVEQVIPASAFSH
jgi:hypothetical protein